jgi:hypothetical protein
LAAEVRLLTEQRAALEEEIERFRMWAEVTKRSFGEEWSERDSKPDESICKIKDLEAELKKMVTKFQEDKLTQAQRQSKKGTLLSQRGNHGD